ncbi:MAG: sugar nucleotide-binding protein [Halioglobus sp.]
MRVLVIGAETPVGRTLQDLLRRRGRHVEILSSSDCRWKSERQAKKSLVRAACEFVVDVRIQAAADGGIQIHELDLKRSQWLAKSCHKNMMIYVALSSARLFSGSLGRPYVEDDLSDNSGALAQLLSRAEDFTRENCERHLILRFGSIFSHRGINEVPRMLGQLAEGETMSLSDHLSGSPVAADDGAWVISGILDQLSTGAQVWGSYHYCSSDPTNCYEFAEVLLASASQFSDISLGAVELLGREQWQEPLNRTLDCSKLRSTFAIKQSPWRKHVADTVKLYFQSLK